MELLSSLKLTALGLPIVATAVVCLLIGYVIGNRRNKRLRRQLQREHNEQSLALLDAKAKYERVQKAADQQERKDRLLAMTLKKLKLANQRVAELTTTIQSQEKRHFMSVSRLKLNAVDANEKAEKAADIARQAMTHLREAKHNSSSTTSAQTRNGARVVEHKAADTRLDAVAQVAKSRSSRLARIRSRNNTASSPTA